MRSFTVILLSTALLPGTALAGSGTEKPEVCRAAPAPSATPATSGGGLRVTLAPVVLAPVVVGVAATSVAVLGVVVATVGVALVGGTVAVLSGASTRERPAEAPWPAMAVGAALVGVGALPLLVGVAHHGAVTALVGAAGAAVGRGLDALVVKRGAVRVEAGTGFGGFRAPCDRGGEIHTPGR